MKARTISLCISTALFLSFSTSSVFAQVSSVPDRASLNGTDAIKWLDQGNGNTGGADYLSYLVDANFGTNPNLHLPNVASENGVAIAVSQAAQHYGAIVLEPSNWYRPTNFSDGEYILETAVPVTSPWINQINPFTFVFSDPQGTEFCGIGTQFAPYDFGVFNARIEAFDTTGSLGYVDGTGSDQDGTAAFVGIRSETPMTKVELSITNAGGVSGSYAGLYAINEVTLTACPEPEVPIVSCEGFAAPMANHPVKTKKNRVFPLKMELFSDGFELTDADLIAAPVVKVEFIASDKGAEATDVSDKLLSVGHGTDGNQFEFTDDDIWQYNLKSDNHTAPGTYEVTVVSGDPEEYVIDQTCKTSFIKE